MSFAALTATQRRHHLWLPLLAFVLAALLLEVTPLDLWVADALYAWSGHSWSLRDAWVTRTLIHEDGRKLVTLFTLALVVVLAASHAIARLKPYRLTLWYLLTSALLAALVINVLKRLSHVDCPWDLLRYGGEHEYWKKFLPLPAGQTRGACFPAGHASAAYAWLGLYYVCLLHRPQWRLATLAGVIGLGLVFGLGQQLRGAHFLSHDLWTLGLCWFTATAVYLVFARAQGGAAN